MQSNLNGNWDAAAFFEHLCYSNVLAQSEGFTFCRVSGLEGFEEAVSNMQSSNAFVCVSDTADGYTELNNTPRTRRIKTVFFAMRHAAEDMAARSECMEIMRELFRQFMSRLLLEKVRLEQNSIYLDQRISFNEIDKYFFSGGAGAYFQIAVDVFTDLRHNSEEWTDNYNTNQINFVYFYDVLMTGFYEDNKVNAIKEIRQLCDVGLADAKALADKCTADGSSVLFNHLTSSELEAIKPRLETLEYVLYKIVAHGQSA